MGMALPRDDSHRCQDTDQDDDCNQSQDACPRDAPTHPDGRLLGSVCTPFITMSHTLERWPLGMGSWLRGLRAASSWSPLAQVAQLLQALQRTQHGTARAMANAPRWC